MKSFTVKRSTWLRGDLDGASVLHRERDGKQCCLGFLARQCQVPKKALMGKYMLRPHQTMTRGVVPRVYRKQLPEALMKKPALLDEIMTMNDSIEMTERTREAKLKKLFEAADIKVLFVP